MITNFDSLFAGHIDMENAGYAGTPVNDRGFRTNSSPPSSTRPRRWLADGSSRLQRFWMAEHHFQREGYECIPNVLMAALPPAHLTRHIKLGCGFNIARCGTAAACEITPRRTSERRAVIFGVGARLSHRRSKPSGRMLDQPANRELFEEQVDIIFKAFRQRVVLATAASITPAPASPYRGYDLKELHGCAPPVRLPVECWQPVQGGTARALDFMAKHGSGADRRRFGRRRCDAPGRLGLAGAHARSARNWKWASGCASASTSTSPRTGAGASAKPQILRREHEDVRRIAVGASLERRADRDHARSQAGASAKLPRIEDAIANGGVLCGPPEQVIEHLKSLERRYPALIGCR